jgi:hypothetical protein
MTDESPVAMPSLISPHATILPTRSPGRRAARAGTAPAGKKAPRGRTPCLPAAWAPQQRRARACSEPRKPLLVPAPVARGRFASDVPATVSLRAVTTPGRHCRWARRGCRRQRRAVGWALPRIVRVRVRYEAKRSWQGRRQRRDGMVSTCTYVAVRSRAPYRVSCSTGDDTPI